MKTKFHKSFERILIGGNHLASALINILGASEAKFPPYNTDFTVARQTIRDLDKYDLWVCWATIMRERDAMGFNK